MANTIKIQLADYMPLCVERKLNKNEKLCETCNGIGLVVKPSLQNPQYIEGCRKCHNGIIQICEHCGHEYIFGSCTCQISRKLKDEQRIKELFNKAEKITPDEAEKRGITVFADPYSDHLFFDWFEVDSWFEDDENAPSFLWATVTTKISMNAIDIIFYACEELHEDAEDNISDEDIKELQTFLNKWCEKQMDTITYYPNENIAITINKEVVANK